MFVGIDVFICCKLDCVIERYNDTMSKSLLLNVCECYFVSVPLKKRYVAVLPHLLITTYLNPLCYKSKAQ